MANTIATGLKLDLLAEAALTAFKARLLPLRLFSTSFVGVELQGTDVVRVPYYPLATATSKDFNGSYVHDAGTDTQSKPVTVNKRKYQPLSFTSQELARQPLLNVQQHGMLRGQKLAEDVLADILSLVTLANFGAAALTTAAANFDFDDVFDLRTACNDAHWPIAGRGLILDTAYTGALLKDAATIDAISGLSLAEWNTLPVVNGFSIAETTLIPANGEHLVGMAVYPSAILVAMAPIPPAGRVADVVDYRVYTDPDTGITLAAREWADANADTTKWTLECNYGYGLGETAAIKRIVSQ